MSWAAGLLGAAQGVQKHWKDNAEALKEQADRDYKTALEGKKEKALIKAAKQLQVDKVSFATQFGTANSRPKVTEAEKSYWKQVEDIMDNDIPEAEREQRMLRLNQNFASYTFNKQPTNRVPLKAGDGGKGDGDKGDNIFTSAWNAVTGNNEKPASKESSSEEDALLAEFGLDKRQGESGKGVGKLIMDDPIIGGLLRGVGKSYQATSDAVDYYAGKGVGAAKKVANTPRNIPEAEMTRLKGAVAAFRKNPTVNGAQKILHSGLITGREKQAIELFIKRNK